MRHEVHPLNRVASLALLALILCGTAMSAEAGDVMRYVYHSEPGGDEARNAYAWHLLGAALERTRFRYGDYVLTPSTFADERPNATSLLKGDGGITVSVFTPQVDFAGKLVPVRVPIDRGVLGYRLLLIRAGDQARFESLRTREDLKTLRVGALVSWVDVPIMVHAGLTVVPGDSFEGLFKMLSARRFDALSRSAGEIRHELAERQEDLPGIVVERSLALHYPMPVYFWFRNDRAGRRMAERVDVGLKKMLADGSFASLFHAEFDAVLAPLDLAHRHIIELENPFLSPDEPLADRRLWYSPQSRP